MDRIEMKHDKVVQWKPGWHDLRFDRVVTGISGDTVTIDAPLANAIEKEARGGSALPKTMKSSAERSQGADQLDRTRDRSPAHDRLAQAIAARGGTPALQRRARSFEREKSHTCLRSR